MTGISTRAIRETMEDLIRKLNLPEETQPITKEEILNYIHKMKNQDYSLLLVEHYINSLNFGEIERKCPNLFYSSLRSVTQSGVHALRQEIIDDRISKYKIPINRFVPTKIMNSTEYNWKPIKDVIEMLQRFDYRPSLLTDTIVKNLWDNGYNFLYPRFLLKQGGYPFNLYGDLLAGSECRVRLTTGEIYRRYKNQLVKTPRYNFSAFYLMSDYIFSDENKFLTEEQKDLGWMHYVMEYTVSDMSRITGRQISSMTYEIRRIIQILNTKECKDYIHGFQKKKTF